MIFEGDGNNWDAELVGGPADGCLDIIVEENNDKPPKYIPKIIPPDGEIISDRKLGKALLNKWKFPNLDPDTKIAVYKFKEFKISKDYCLYEYVETTIMDKYKKNYL